MTNLTHHTFRLRALGSLLVPAMALLLAVGVTTLPAGAAPATRTVRTTFKWIPRAVPASTNFHIKALSCHGTSCLGLEEACSPGGCGGLLPDDDVFSSNDGTTWAQGTFPKGSGEASQLSCGYAAKGTAALCASLGTKGPLGPKEEPALFVTANYGKSWSVLPQTTDSFTAVACGSSTSCAALGYRQGQSDYSTSTVLVTSNGAKSWTTAKFPANTAYVEAATCASATDCLATGESYTTEYGVIFQSTNLGRSWKQLTVPVGVTALSSVGCNGLVCVATSSEDVLVSANGGRSWTVRAVPSTLDVESVSCLSATTCVAVGATSGYPGHPAAAVSHNGGMTWAKAVLPSYDGALLAAACVGTTVCVTAGSRDSLSGGTPEDEYPLVLTY